jgi:tRNA pseudouridine55 synthase
VVTVGAATRLGEYVQAMPKTYQAGILLGARSDTDDADGQVRPVAEVQPPNRDEVKAALDQFIGAIDQAPPSHSAAKVAGQRAYRLARKGKPVSLQPRQVMIHGIRLVRYEFPLLKLDIHCGKGTYIRSLARDLGERLGCGGLVQSLCRTQVGPFDRNHALALPATPEEGRARLRPAAEAVAELPRIDLSAVAVKRFRRGQAVTFDSGLVVQGTTAREIAVFDSTGKLIGVGHLDPDRRLLQPRKVMPADA